MGFAGNFSGKGVNDERVSLGWFGIKAKSLNNSVSEQQPGASFPEHCSTHSSAGKVILLALSARGATDIGVWVTTACPGCLCLCVGL